MENVDVGPSEYISKARENGVDPVVYPDQQNLKLFLTGKIDACEQLDNSVLDRNPIDGKANTQEELEKRRQQQNIQDKYTSLSVAMTSRYTIRHIIPLMSNSFIRSFIAHLQQQL